MPLMNMRSFAHTSFIRVKFLTDFLQEERVICQELDDTLGIGIAHRKIGEALNELGNYESALKHHQKYLGNTCKIQ